MQFTGIANPFGTDAYEPISFEARRTTTYYKSMRLDKKPNARRRAPKPLSQTVANFLLTF